MPVSLKDENFMIKVLENAFLEGTAPQLPLAILWPSCIAWVMNSNRNFGLDKHDAEVIRSLPMIIQSDLSWSAGYCYCRWFVMPGRSRYPSILGEENSLLPNLIIIPIELRNITINIRKPRLHSYKDKIYTCLIFETNQNYNMFYPCKTYLKKYESNDIKLHVG